jgi:hypothetical protein
MAAAALLSLPVAWIYLLTRAKRGYQQSVVQLLVVLPTVVAGIVLLVKYSLALAFSLAGIVAAVRFRNSLDDSKDAVYVFLATAIGLSSAVNLPVAGVLSICFNILALALWYTDFGSAPVELDGRLAERKLQRAKQMARTGTFVARMDDEVLKNMTTEQLEGLDIVPDGAPGGVVGLDEQAEGRPSRQSLHAQGAAAGEQVDDSGPLQVRPPGGMFQDIEHGLPGPVGSWPCGLARRGLDRSATQGPGDDPQDRPDRVWSAWPATA